MNLSRDVIHGSFRGSNGDRRERDILETRDGPNEGRHEGEDGFGRLSKEGIEFLKEDEWTEDMDFVVFGDLSGRGFETDGEFF